MQTLQADYFAAYRNLKLSRDAKGVLVAETHRSGSRLRTIPRRRLIGRPGEIKAIEELISHQGAVIE